MKFKETLEITIVLCKNNEDKKMIEIFNKDLTPDLYICVEHFPLYLDEAFEQFNRKQDEVHKGTVFLTTEKIAKELLKKSQENKNLDNPLKYSISVIIDNEQKLREFKNKFENILKNKKHLCKNIKFELHIPDGNTKTELKKFLKDKVNSEKFEIQTVTNIANKKYDIETNNSINNMCVSNNFRYLLKKMKDGSMNSVISTGFNKLDEALYGGLRSKRLYTVGGIPGIGKTTFVMNIAENIALFGYDVIVFSLEMSRYELEIKGLTRRIFLNNYLDHFKKKTSLISKKLLSEKLPTATELQDKIYPNINNFDIENYYANNKGISCKDKKESQRLCKLLQEAKEKKEQSLLQTAESEYEKLGKHLYIYEGSGNVNTNIIRNVLNNFAKVNNKIPKLVIVDYLQAISPYNIRFNISDKQNIDRNITELKKISGDYNTSVMVISSFNREHYYKGSSLKSFKESGSIEYTSDVLIGLQLEEIDYVNYNDMQEKIEEVMNAFPRKIELSVLKNRTYKVMKSIILEYYTKFDCFIQEKENNASSNKRHQAQNVLHNKNLYRIHKL